MPRTRKKSLSLIELAIVVILVSAIGAIATFKGSQFLNSIRADREKKALIKYFNCCQIIADLSSQVIEIQVIELKNKKFRLFSPQAKISKTFSQLSLEGSLPKLVLYPYSGCSSNFLKIRVLNQNAVLDFSIKTGLYSIVIK